MGYILPSLGASLMSRISFLEASMKNCNGKSKRVGEEKERKLERNTSSER